MTGPHHAVKMLRRTRDRMFARGEDDEDERDLAYDIDDVLGPVVPYMVDGPFG